MRLTPQVVMTALRRLAGLGALTAAVLLIGPFHYADFHLPFPDTAAHGLLFYGLSVLAFCALPRLRSAEVALGVVAVGAISEVVQSLVGREMSWHDLMGDTIGVTAAYVPVAVQRLRELARVHPDATFAEIRRLDRRRGGLVRSPLVILQSLGGR
jgi:hypothetical protein